jgi:hypothetical protein
MTDHLRANLGPLLGFLFTIGTVVFIALTAHRTERPGALEALQEESRRQNGEPASSPAEPPAPTTSDS